MPLSLLKTEKISNILQLLQSSEVEYFCTDENIFLYFCVDIWFLSLILLRRGKKHDFRHTQQQCSGQHHRHGPVFGKHIKCLSKSENQRVHVHWHSGGQGNLYTTYTTCLYMR